MHTIYYKSSHQAAGAAETVPRGRPTMESQSTRPHQRVQVNNPGGSHYLNHNSHPTVSNSISSTSPLGQREAPMWINKSTESLFVGETDTRPEPNTEAGQLNQNRTQIESNSVKWAPANIGEDGDQMQAPPMANSTRIMRQPGMTHNLIEFEGAGNMVDVTHIRSPRKLNQDYDTIGAQLNIARGQQKTTSGVGNQELQQLASERNQKSYHDDSPLSHRANNSNAMYSNGASGQIASVDDRPILLELVQRTPPCRSDYFEHVFVFLLAVTPLFQLHLIADFILMKYLLPKVHGHLSRIILTTAAAQGSFTELCIQLRQEFFCDRAIHQLAQNYFFLNFQTASQSVTEFLDLMHAAFTFLQIPLTQCEAIQIMLENLLPENITRLSGRPFPTHFSQMPQLINFLNRQRVVDNQRLTQNSQRDRNISHGRGETDYSINGHSMMTQIPSRNDHLQAKPFNNFRKCFNCGDSSHIRPNCPRLAKNQIGFKATEQFRSDQNFAQNTNSVQCFKCQQFGHIQRFCPLLRVPNMPGNVKHAGQ